MFPFRPRRPMLGGKLGRKRKAEAEAVAEEAAAKAAAAAAEPPPLLQQIPDTNTSTRRGTRSKTLAGPRKVKTKTKKPTPLAELRNGGPVERAIRSDLDNLWALYDEELVRRRGDSSQAAVVSATNTDGSLLLSSHFAPGSTFRLFKDVYRRGKFGIVHTRCIPPRSDREEFAQMIYSACLGLLKGSLGNIIRSSTSTGGGNKCETDDGAATVTTADDTTINNAAFALFALYTLYETCPLPEFPSLYDANNQNSSNRDTESSVDSAVFSEAERAALTTLPLGLTGAGEQSRVIYRRAYKSPIRVGHGDYARIVQLQDLCLERMSYCECRRTESYIDGLEREDTMKDLNDQDQWRCQCSTAGDCLEIIHRLQSNESFDYCEYAGPCSVEGLAGSAEYFDRVVEPPADALDNPQYGTILTNEDMVGHDALALVDLKSELDIGGLESIYADYQKTLESVSKAPQLQGSNSSHRSQQSKQTQLVQDVLRPVLRTWQRNRGKPKSIERLNLIQDHFEVGGEASPAYGWLPPTNEDESDDVEPEAPPKRRSVWNQLERSQRTQDAARRKEEAIAPHNEEKTLESMNEEAMETSASPSEPVSTVKFSLPCGISPSLGKGIRGALHGIDGDIKNYGREEDMLPNAAPAPIGSGGDSRRYVDISMELLEEEDLDMAPYSRMDEDEETIITHHTGYSTIPPAGTGGAAIALRDLLSYANETDDKREDHFGEEEVGEESANEETSIISATSGVAKNMLGTLISQAHPEVGRGGGGSKAQRELPKQTAKRRRKQEQDNFDDGTSVVSAPPAVAGGGMLDALIKQAHSNTEIDDRDSVNTDSDHVNGNKDDDIGDDDVVKGDTSSS